MAKKDLAPGLTARSTLLSLVFVWVSNIWLAHSGLITHATQIGESVPPIPAVAAIILIVAINPLLRFLNPSFVLSRAETLVIYSVVAIAISMSSVGMVRYFLPVLTAPFYYATPENEFAFFTQYLPHWMVVTDQKAIIGAYEGIGRNAPIPWLAWITPLALWSSLFIAIFWTMLCLVVIFRKQWIDQERLVFPIARFGLEITGTGLVRDEGAGSSNLIGKRPFFRNPYMWIGFSLAFLYNLMNILHAFYPSIPGPGTRINLSHLFTDRPWNAVRPIAFQFRPAVFGLAYLMPLDINFSVWSLYFLLKIEAIAASVFGYNLPGFPYIHDQSSGAFLALVIAFCWVAKKQIQDVISGALGKSTVDDRAESLSFRIAFFGGVGGIVFICCWCVIAGMTVTTILMYFGLIFGFALVYTKIRAEAGAPMIWLFPYGEHKRVMVNAFGSRAFTPNGSYQNLTVFASLTFLSRGYFPAFMAYQLEALKHSDEVQMSRRVVPIVIMFALVIGLLAAYQTHLNAYYEHGANILEGGQGLQGGTRGATLVRQEYNLMKGYQLSKNAPDFTRTSAVGFGFIFTTLLAFLRRNFLQFPFHPLGFAMVTAYGDPLWGAFFVAWILKTLITRIGGIGLYRQLTPGFLGVALGHFFTAGILWGTLAAIGDDIFRGYGVWFG